jgi:hypothetical protein
MNVAVDEGDECGILERLGVFSSVERDNGLRRVVGRALELLVTAHGSDFAVEQPDGCDVERELAAVAEMFFGFDVHDTVTFEPFLMIGMP